MNDGHSSGTGSRDARFDALARAAHERSLQALTPRVQAQLQQRRRAAFAAQRAPHPLHRRHGWAWLGAPALALALAFGVPWRTAQEPADGAGAAASAVAATNATTPSPLDQDPDFYLWLASSDAVALASE